MTEGSYTRDQSPTTEHPKTCVELRGLLSSLLIRGLINFTSVSCKLTCSGRLVHHTALSLSKSNLRFNYSGGNRFCTTVTVAFWYSSKTLWLHLKHFEVSQKPLIPSLTLLCIVQNFFYDWVWLLCFIFTGNNMMNLLVMSHFFRFKSLVLFSS